MKAAFLILGLFLLYNTALAQNIDYNQIEAAVSDKESSFYYPNLVNRFNKGDSTIGKEELLHLYYGFVFNANYAPEASRTAERRIKNLNYSKLYKEAIMLADSLLEVFPVSLSALFEKSFASHA